MHTSARDANLLGALGLALADRLDAAAELAGGSSAAEALVALGGEAAGGSIDALARIVGLSHSGTVRLVDRLAREGLVERRRGADQRSAALVLTPAGRRGARRVRPRREAEMQSIFVLLTDDQQSALRQVAERVLDNADDVRRVCRLCDLEACGRSRGHCPADAGHR
jgi:MarR family transcriptional repressor of emrRAB